MGIDHTDLPSKPELLEGVAHYSTLPHSHNEKVFKRLKKILNLILKNTCSGAATTTSELATMVAADPTDKTTDANDVRNWIRLLRLDLGSCGLKIDSRVQLGDKNGYVLSAVVESEVSEAVPKVEPRELSRLLNSICRLHGIGPAERAILFEKWYSSPGVLESVLRVAALILVPKTFDPFLRDFPQSIPLADAWRAADLFNIHRILVDPLLSEEMPGDVLTLDFDHDFFDPREGIASPGKSFGTDAVYRIPKQKLRSTDAAFVYLTVGQHGESDSHEHPGDELIVVLSGEIYVSLHGTGVRQRLEPGDAIHFYAEQKHQVQTIKPSRLFIVRFYQLEGVRTRQDVWREIEENLNTNRKLSAQAKAWVRELHPSCKPRPDTRIRDPLGLARFLEAVATSGLTQTPAGDPKLRSKLEAIDAETIENTSLTQIAAEYGVEEFLLDHFRHPAEPLAVVLRKADFKPHSTEGGEYWLPIRNLSCSDISIARVVLKPGSATPPNLHPGFEAILMEEGAVEIQIDGSAVRHTISAAKNRLCHFNSSKNHTVTCTGSTVARFFVIRFYRDGQTPAEQIPNPPLRARKARA